MPRGFGEQLSFFEGESPKLTLIERFNAVKASAGFWPVSREEITRALILIGRQGVKSGTAEHLNAVLLHQHNAATDTPAAAVRRIAYDLVGYWKDARLSVAHLRDLETIVEMASSDCCLADVVMGVSRGVAQLVRYIDLSALAEQGDMSNDVFTNQFVAYTEGETDQVLMQHIANTLAATSIPDARRLLPLAIEDSSRRVQFWEEQLQDSQRHALARPIAARALRGAGIEPIG